MVPGANNPCANTHEMNLPERSEIPLSKSTLDLDKSMLVTRLWLQLGRTSFVSGVLLRVLINVNQML